MTMNLDKNFREKTTSIIFWTYFSNVWCILFFYFFRGSLINFQSLCIVEGILRFLQDVWFIFAVFVLVLNDDELGQKFPGEDNINNFLNLFFKCVVYSLFLLFQGKFDKFSIAVHCRRNFEIFARCLVHFCSFCPRFKWRWTWTKFSGKRQRYYFIKMDEEKKKPKSTTE